MDLRVKSSEADVTPKNGIWDMTIRELEIILQKLETDNHALKKDLLRSRMQLNERDEDILRLQRELLETKKETLFVIREVSRLPDNIKKGNFEVVNEFLVKWQAYQSCIEIEQAMVSSTSNQVGHVHDQTPPVSPSELAGVGKEEPYTIDDAEKHVRAPLSCQYRHLRLRPRRYGMTGLCKKNTSCFV